MAGAQLDAGLQLDVAFAEIDAGAADVRIVVVPDGATDGWDLADPLPEGWTSETVETALAETVPYDPDGEEQGTFRVQWRKAGKAMPGLHFRVLDKDPETGETVPGWHWFGSRLDVLGYTRDGDNRDWGRYLAVHDADRRIHHIAMPMATMAGDGAEYRRELLRHGFVLAPVKSRASSWRSTSRRGRQGVGFAASTGSAGMGRALCFPMSPSVRAARRRAGGLRVGVEPYLRV